MSSKGKEIRRSTGFHGDGAISTEVSSEAIAGVMLTIGEGRAYALLGFSEAEDTKGHGRVGEAWVLASQGDEVGDQEGEHEVPWVLSDAAIQAEGGRQRHGRSSGAAGHGSGSRRNTLRPAGQVPVSVEVVLSVTRCDQANA
ncbi:unnamed protein product [Ilex paraguariensis]|uniref:Uncharacterized protein n=1 Tax=Ilex paraguariensis TaxID=185542 RepID=A0ABC8QYD4_9AQUA